MDALRNIINVEALRSRSPAPTSALPAVCPSGERTRKALVLLWLLPHPCLRLGVVPGRIFTFPLDPRAAVRPRPLQHRQVPSISGEETCQRVPRAVVLPRPLQHLQVPAPSGGVGRCQAPRASVLPRPLQRIKVPATSSGSGPPASPTGTRSPSPTPAVRRTR